MALIDVFLTAFTSLCGDYLEGHQIHTVTTDITVYGHPIILCLYQQNL